MRKYIGTKQPDEKSKGNLHEIWYEYQPGWFICNTKPKHEENRNGLFIDHNHETGKIRQLLCLNCNTLLGHASDDIEILTKAIIYLNKHRETF